MLICSLFEKDNGFYMRRYCFITFFLIRDFKLKMN